MQSFDDGRRRSPRSQAPVERRSERQGDPFEQRLDRWVSTGRQLIDGVAGSRPGSRPPSRRPEGRQAGRSGFDGLGRWVEERLDWLLDDGDDWPEPWQEDPRRPRSPRLDHPGSGGPAPGPSGMRAASPAAVAAPQVTERSRVASPASQIRGGRRAPLVPEPAAAARPRRRLEAVSRRSAPETPFTAPPSAADPDQEWPSEELFRLNRWQRPPANVNSRFESNSSMSNSRPDLDAGLRPQPTSAARPLPRSSRRR